MDVSSINRSLNNTKLKNKEKEASTVEYYFWDVSTNNSNFNLEVNINFEGKIFHNFYALKECWLQLREYVHSDYPELITQFSSEIGFLFPNESGLNEDVNLESFAAGSSERRLSRESEQIFRIVWGITSCIQLISKRTPLKINFYQTAEADRVSLQFISYLCSTITNYYQIRLHYGIFPSSWGERTVEIRQNLLEKLIEGLPPFRNIINLPVMDKANSQFSLEEEKIQSWLEKGTYEKEDENINHVIQNLIMWGNYEGGMCLLEKCFDKGDNREQLSYYWMKMGLVYAFCGYFTKAMDCYQTALNLTLSKQRKSAICMYLALIASKRLGNEEEAQEWIKKGFVVADMLTGKEADIEKGWLCNVRALSAFREKDFKSALHYSQKAFNYIKEYQGGDALHLKVNVLSNMSVLLEQMNFIDKALNTWENFEQFVNHGATEAFTKVYFFRLGALKILCGNRKEGLENMEKSFNIAKEINDVFHACYIANELAIYTSQALNINVAKNWLIESAKYAKKFGDNKLALLQEKKVASILDCETSMDIEQIKFNSPLTKIGRPFYPIHIPNKL